MADNRTDMSIEMELLKELSGKIHLSQPKNVREEVIDSAIDQMCTASKNLLPDEDVCRKEFSNEKRQDIIAQIQKYDRIEQLLNDPRIEDIIINGVGPIYAHVQNQGFKELPLAIKDYEELHLLIRKILTFGGKEELKEINNVDLPGMRGRANIVLSPNGPELTITKIKSKPLSVIDLIKARTLNLPMAALLWLYMEGFSVKPANILIAGGPGCGKTTLLNALMAFIPANHHIVTIEDTFELRTDWIHDISRLESNEKASMQDLVKNSLRMRADRIIIGEVRGEEAQDMMTAMNVGKYSMGTIHSGDIRKLLQRLQSHPMNVPPALINLIDVFVVLNKIVTEIPQRIITQIAETSNMESNNVTLAPTWRYRQSMKNFEQLSPSTVYRDKLSALSGVPNVEIISELKKRERFLAGLLDNNVFSIDDVHRECERYIKETRNARASG